MSLLDFPWGLWVARQANRRYHLRLPLLDFFSMGLSMGQTPQKKTRFQRMVQATKMMEYCHGILDIWTSLNQSWGFHQIPDLAEFYQWRHHMSWSNYGDGRIFQLAMFDAQRVPNRFCFFLRFLGYIHQQSDISVCISANEVHTPPMSVSFLNGENDDEGGPSCWRIPFLILPMS